MGEGDLNLKMKSEQKMGVEVVRHLMDEGFILDDIHEEVSVVLDGMTVSADIVALRDGEISVIEIKDHMCDTLVRQCLRWQGHADWIIAVTMEPRMMGNAHSQRRTNLRRYGVGVMYMGPTTLKLLPDTYGDYQSIVIKPRRQETVNHDLLLSSLASVRGPGAGSAGVKRIRPDKWDPVREALKESGPATLAWLRAELQKYTPGEWREFQRAVKNGDAPGIGKIPHTTPVQYTRSDT